MRRFVEGIDRGQATLFPECLEDWIDADSPVRVIDAFVEKLLGFEFSHVARVPALGGPVSLLSGKLSDRRC